jgi:hypothetical protein
LRLAPCKLQNLMQSSTKDLYKDIAIFFKL